MIRKGGIKSGGYLNQQVVQYDDTRRSAATLFASTHSSAGLAVEASRGLPDRLLDQVGDLLVRQELGGVLAQGVDGASGGQGLDEGLGGCDSRRHVCRFAQGSFVWLYDLWCEE